MTASAPILSALHATKYVRGYTHSYYRYPAATSPGLARELILAFTEPGDLVCDPFMGGGTVPVETLAAGRQIIGSDLNELAVFVSGAKTTPPTRRSWRVVEDWAADASVLSGSPQRDDSLTSSLPNPLGRALASGRASVAALEDPRARRVAGCALLRLGQWALEANDEVPAVDELRAKLGLLLEGMRTGMDELATAARDAGLAGRALAAGRSLHCCAAGELAALRAGRRRAGEVRLLLTSPPYPGVHVLYHRWQVRGRRETAAPYWVIGAQDGHYMPYYTMGGRSEIGRQRYFRTLTETFASLRPLLAADALVTVVVGFAHPDTQDGEFRRAMAAAGYAPSEPLDVAPDTLVRDVPNRRWYVRGKKHSAAREVLLFFRPA